MWTLRGLVDFCNKGEVQTQINGKWVPARSIDGRSIPERFREAWAVLTGKADCFTWPEGQ